MYNAQYRGQISRSYKRFTKKKSLPGIKRVSYMDKLKSFFSGFTNYGNNPVQ